MDGEIQVSDESSGLLSETLINQMPEIEYATPLAPPDWFQKFTLTAGDKNIKASGQYAGKDYFNIFLLNYLMARKRISGIYMKPIIPAFLLHLIF